MQDKAKMLHRNKNQPNYGVVITARNCVKLVNCGRDDVTTTDTSPQKYGPRSKVRTRGEVQNESLTDDNLLQSSEKGGENTSTRGM